MSPELRLETERLVLRPYREDDAEDVYRVFSQPVVFRYTPDTPYTRLETAHEFIEQARRLAKTDPPASFRHFLAVTRRSDGAYLGMTGVGGVEYDRTQNEVFYILGPDHWGKGYATEAAREVLRYAFRDLAIPRVIGIVQPANVASVRVLEKIGLRRAGVVRGLPPEFRYHEGELRFELERAEYLALPARPATAGSRPVETTSPELPPHHRIVEAALAWALARCGDPGYAGLCYAFLEDAIERGNGIVLDGQGTTAKEAADAYGCRTEGPAPRGAYVFYDSVGPLDGVVRNWGHMGLSLGDGRVVHAWDVVRVDTVAAVEQLDGLPGWTRPVYLGWAPIERVLVNAHA